MHQTVGPPQSCRLTLRNPHRIVRLRIAWADSEVSCVIGRSIICERREIENVRILVLAELMSDFRLPAWTAVQGANIRPSSGERQ